MMHAAREQGVTMIETMIALALAALLIVLGMPTFSSMLAGIRVRGAGEEILGGLQRARVEAMKRNQSVTFRLDSQDGGGWSVILDVDQTTLTSKPAAAGSTYVEGDLDTFARFNNFGMRTAPVGGDMTFSVSAPESGDCQPAGDIRCMSIVVRAGGQLRLCDPLRLAGDPQACSFGP